MDIIDRETRRVTFDAVAEDYEAARPGYPDEAIEALAAAVDLSAGTRCLEVGVGTGQATRKIAPYGCAITDLEPGKNLAQVARKALASFSNVHIETRSFEDLEIPALPFDLLYSATAFHWTDPAVRWDRAARLVRRGGYVALLTNKSMEAVLETKFHLAVQPIYERHGADKRGGRGLKNTTVAAAEALHSELEEDTRFEICLTDTYPWELSLTASELARLHMTFSDHLRMPTEVLNALHADLKSLIDDKFGGSVVKPYETELVVARRV